MLVAALAMMVALQTAVFQATEHSISVQVDDQLGAAIPGAEVFVHQDGAGLRDGTRLSDQTTRTDPSGRAHMEAPGGFFDVCVMASSFTPVCKKVEVRGHDVAARFRMRVDPMVMKRFGDTVE